jgi:hypothetical protein
MERHTTTNQKWLTQKIRGGCDCELGKKDGVGCYSSFEPPKFRHDDDDDDDHGVRRADTARALAWWRHLVASHEAIKLLHRAM